MPADVSPYDALLLVSFGGPEGPDDVVPFLRNVTAGRGIPDERLVEVGRHYELFGGRSPINDQNRALLAAIREDLVAHDITIPVYWGNRNWDPYLRDTIEQMTADGVRRALCFVTSAYASYSGCRQYREDLTGAVADLPDAPTLDRTRVYFNHPGFVDPFVDGIGEALDRLPDNARLVFVTHSIPIGMNVASGTGGSYVAEHRDVAETVTAEVARRRGRPIQQDLVFCSRSGPPEVPWLEPDVNDFLEELSAGTPVVLVPIGFVSDHMEVVYDLDTEARATAERLGLPFERLPTPGTDPRFVALVRDLLVERAAIERGEEVAQSRVGSLDAAWDRCAVDCCVNPRSTREAICGSAR